MRHYIPIVFISVFLLTGCKAYQSQLMGFENQSVIYDDGINHFEALYLAEQHFEKSSYLNSYDSKKAKVLTDRFVAPYPEYWFVSFEPKKANLDFWRYLIVIQKRSGKIIFSGPYVPLDQVDYDWVFKYQK